MPLQWARKRVYTSWLAAIVMLIAHRAGLGQTLNFDDPIPAPPILGQENVVADRQSELHAAMVESRIVADTADDPGEAAHARWMTAVDALLRSRYAMCEDSMTAAPELFLLVSTLHRHRELLHDAFNMKAIDSWVTLTAVTAELAASDVGSPDEAVTQLRAWAQRLDTHLQRVSDFDVHSAASASLDEAIDLDQLADRIEALPVDVPARPSLLNAHAVLERGMASPRHREHARGLIASIDSLVTWLTVIESTPWIDAPLRAVCHETARDHMSAFMIPRERTRAVRVMRSLGVQSTCVEHLTALADGRIQTKSIQIAVLEALREERRVDWTRANLVLGRMRAYRDRHPDDAPDLTPRDLRTVYKPAHRAYELHEKALLRDAVWLSVRSDESGFMEVLTLIADHDQSLKDLDRIRAISTWIANAGLINSGQQAAFSSRMRKLARELEQPERREDVRRQLDVFATQLDALYPVPYEIELRVPEPTAVELSAGRHADLVKRIDEARAAWIEAWAKGDSYEPAVRDLLRLATLTQSMQQVTTLLDVNRRHRVNAWAGFDASDESLAVLGVQASNRLKLASVALADNAVATADRHEREFNRIQAIVSLVAMIDTAAASLAPPTNARALLVQLEAPRPQDWASGSRVEIALVCRALSESDAANRRGKDAVARGYLEWANDLAGRIVDRVAMPTTGVDN